MPKLWYGSFCCVTFLLGLVASPLLPLGWSPDLVFVADDGFGAWCTRARPCALPYARIQHAGATVVLVANSAPYNPEVSPTCPCDRDGWPLRDVLAVIPSR